MRGQRCDIHAENLLSNQQIDTDLILPSTHAHYENAP